MKRIGFVLWSQLPRSQFKILKILRFTSCVCVCVILNTSFSPFFLFFLSFFFSPLLLCSFLLPFPSFFTSTYQAWCLELGRQHNRRHLPHSVRAGSGSNSSIHRAMDYHLQFPFGFGGTVIIYSSLELNENCGYIQ